MLEKLVLGDNYLADEGIAALADALVNNSRLKELDLGFRMVPLIVIVLSQTKDG